VRTRVAKARVKRKNRVGKLRGESDSRKGLDANREGIIEENQRGDQEVGGDMLGRSLASS
jgi:hypothetical protein